ncbi:zinc finger protein GAI-ASSOCIATED FACTOR 1-like [Helicoverpa zea]|uniref:zinc finger protein GAI-ASSOCIATED FACTOR 1-like n=1 Tax=Helicoverpa zea TaxID=7113 RepID=UPI001F571E4C|nr:zinc finger protein GAI-ASSOCIATED FACTOR 1-like [Helicoverpa zea]
MSENQQEDKMSAPFTKLNAPISRLAVVCRGCLAESGEMKNMYEWGLYEDYFTITAIETSRRAGISELLCSTCEAAMMTCKQFRERCQLSDKILKTSLVARSKKKVQKFRRNQVTCILHDQKLAVLITAPKTDSRINLPCPYHCKDCFFKKTDLQSHLKKMHCVSDSFEIELQYYCPEENCAYHITSDKNKWFSGRKFLNQHINKVHKAKTFHCNECNQCFATETEFVRHSKICNFVFICQICDTKYSTNEKLMVHLKRKHPNVHQLYKNEKAEKRKLERTKEAKRAKNVPSETEMATATLITTEIDPKSILENWKFNEKIPKNELTFCDSPKKSSATQIPEDIKNDVTLPSWQSNETKTDEISTQVAFEDLLSLKSQNSEDEIFFSEAVSLSDIQTQTFPVEFGLSRSNKETQSCKNSETQSPDLSIKETQTCSCHYDSPRPNFRLFDSLSSSPASINHTSTETQTGDSRLAMKSDVLLSSTETQTCFDELSSDSI